jgi:hypothetical protein
LLGELVVSGDEPDAGSAALPGGGGTECVSRLLGVVGVAAASGVPAETVAGLFSVEFRPTI